jgi:restriction endonuclease Mrr
VSGADYLERIASATESINIAGLCDRSKKNWYPVILEDTVHGAAKLGLTAREARAALEASLAGSEGDARTVFEF